MPLQYELRLVRDDADQVVFEESPNYSDAFTLLTIGGVLLILGVAFFRGAYEYVSWRKPVSAALTGGLLLPLLSITCFISSSIVLDRRRQSLTIRRRLAGIHWTREYSFREIEKVLEGAPARQKKPLLWLQLRNARTVRLNFWAKRDSLHIEEHQLNNSLRRFEQSASPDRGRKREPMTEDRWWAHTQENASVDMKRYLKRTIVCLGASVGIALAIWPTFAGHPLHPYWRWIGMPLLLVEMALWIAVVSSAGSYFIQWDYVRKLKKIDEEEKTSAD